MSRSPALFRQSDLTRALKGAQAAGLSVARVEVDASGKLVVVIGEPAKAAEGQPTNEWDEVLGDQ